MPRERRLVEAGLLAKGFRLDETHHHRFIYFALDGRKTRAQTKTSHSSKMRDIPDALLSQMARQCMLTKPQLLALVDCPLDRHGFEAVLRQQGEFS